MKHSSMLFGFAALLGVTLGCHAQGADTATTHTAFPEEAFAAPEPPQPQPAPQAADKPGPKSPTAPPVPRAVEPKSPVAVTIAGTVTHFVYVPPGKFTMLKGGEYQKEGWKRNLRGALTGGSAATIIDNQGPPRETTLTKGYWVAVEPINWAQYIQFMRTRVATKGLLNENTLVIRTPEGAIVPDPAAKKALDLAEDPPKEAAQPLDQTGTAEPISFSAVEAFLKWVPTTGAPTVRLPTEAEWEHFARKWHSMRDKDPALAALMTPAVAPFKLVLGEWCSDWYARLIDVKDNVDPKGPPKDEKYEMHVLRQDELARRPGETLRPWGGQGWAGRIRLVIDELPKDPKP